ncbi:hypothetical protein [Vibrio sp. RE88]|uniref:hypothetical protein n=1 Tax=Vibrio sp. RE88 TaxID=2607610 RepID=UPI001493A346|nr:hypothetical protein [Vibrio sp. RE88]NOH61917.1 hypothetical protein [Vibrio sp. RE88]
MINGRVYCFSYILVMSSATVFLGDVGKQYSVFSMLFYSTIITMIFFLLIDAKNISDNHKHIKKDFKGWLLLSSSLLFMWAATYYCTVNGTANYFLAVYFLTTGGVAAFLSRKYIKFFLVIISIIVCFKIEEQIPYTVTFASIFGGIANYVYIKRSYVFSQNTGISPQGLLSIRFYLMAIMALVLSINSESGVSSLALDTKSILVLASLTFVLMIIPNFLAQSALQNVGATQFSFMLTSLPVATFVLESLYHGWWNPEMLAACFSVVIILNYEHVPKVQLKST